MTGMQEALYQAMQDIASNQMAQLRTDKTVTAVVVQCNNALTGEHQVNYQGGNMIAWAEDGTAYTKNTTVYVLVPEGDFSQKKIIVGRATAIGDDNNITFVSSVLNNYNPIGRNTIKAKTENSFALHSYLANDYCLIYDYDNQDESLVSVDIEEFQNYLREAEAIDIEASFMTRLPKDHRNSKTGIYGLTFILAFKDRSTDDEKAMRTYSYTIDTNSMTGNPYAFSSWSDQYGVFPIDIENFSHIQTIYFWSRGFVSEDDLIGDKLWGADIWCNNLEIYGLKPITNQQGDYRLKVSVPYGATFKSAIPDESLTFVASVQYQYTYLTDSCMYYWFIEDARVTTSSEDYQMYGGTGWKRLRDKGTTSNLIVFEKDNHAYENKYLCVAVYKEEVVLKEYFTVYNDACRRNIEIVSNLGTVFSFDRGTPTLTCLLDGKAEEFEIDTATKRPDSYFTFMWSKIDEYGQVTPFNQTLEELEEEYQQALNEGWGYTAISILKMQIDMLRGVEFPKGLNGNQIIYPVSAIANYATFRCSVYAKDRDDGPSFFIGSADIILQNENAADPVDYHILIENGDQVFQYSESGVSPTSDRYIDPQVVKSLTPHFYDPAGLEINTGTYTVTWVVPLEDTMIKIPTELTWNPATEKFEWFTASKIFPLDIVDNFDYSALNNQLTCVVDYNGQQYQKDTRLSFVKIGDNGTNGTDVVAIISDSSNSTILDHDMLTLEVSADDNAKWNTGQSIRDKVLNFNLYQRDEQLVVDTTVFWTIAGTSSTLINIVEGDAQGCALAYGPSSDKAKDKNLIVKAQTTLRDPEMGSQTTYYAYRQIPVVKYYTGRVGYKLHIDTDFTLKQILYNNDGRNPLYNKNQGLRLRLDDPISGFENKVIVLEAIGGVGVTEGERESKDTASFQLLLVKNTKNGLQSIKDKFDEDGKLDVYILPADVYSGMYTNNMIHGKIYADENSMGSPECEFWIPIHMQLNTYGLASLNAWDGNHIEINEEDNYILAPQIGAGVKEQDNTFTGVVMGTQQTYDDLKNRKIGLMGYSHGKQSIWLDSETGNATFGLAEDDPLDPNNPLTEGRIELRPGGISSISNWKLDSRSLYNVSGGDIGPKYSDAPTHAQRSIPHWLGGIILNSEPSYVSVKGHRLGSDDKLGINFDDTNSIVVEGDTFELQFDPNDYSIFTMYRHTNTINDNTFMMYNGAGTGYFVGRTSDSLTYTQAVYKDSSSKAKENIIGWRLSNPIDSKGTTFIIPEENGKEGWAFREVKTILDLDGVTEIPLQKGMTVAVGQLRPEEGEWRREPIVGINAQGRFYSNALQDSTTSLNIGVVGGFGQTAAQKAYVGASIDLFSGAGTNLDNANTLVKFFTDYNTRTNGTSQVYISGSNTTSTEYRRPLSIHGSTVALYGSPTAGTSTMGGTSSTGKDTNNKVIVGTSESTIANGSTYLQLYHNSSKASNFNVNGSLALNVNQKFEGTIVGTSDLTQTGNCTRSVTGTDTETISSTVTKTWNGSATIKTYGNYDLRTNTSSNANGYWQLTSNSTSSMRMGTTNGNPSGSTTSAGFASVGTGNYGYLQFGGASGNSYLASSGELQLYSGSSLGIGARGAKGIQLVATDTLGNILTSGSYLTLVPGGQSSTFTLSSYCGSVYSTRSLNGSRSGVMISDGFQTNWGLFTGSTTRLDGGSGGNNTASISASYDIHSSQNLRAGQSIYAAQDSYAWNGDFKWGRPMTGSWNAPGNSGSHSNQGLWSHFEKLYSLISSLKGIIDTEISNKINDGTIASQDWVRSQNYATQDWVEAKGYATTDWVNGQGFARSSDLNNYVTASTYNGHSHMSSKQFVSHIGYNSVSAAAPGGEGSVSATNIYNTDTEFMYTGGPR